MKFYTTKQARACDLQELDKSMQTTRGESLVARLDGEWRLVLDIYQDHDDPTEKVEGVTAADILHHLDTVMPSYVAVRYYVEEKSPGNAMIADDFTFLHYHDLIEVQVPEERDEPAA